MELSGCKLKGSFTLLRTVNRGVKRGDLSVKVEVIKPEPRGAASPGVKREMEQGSASTPGSSTVKAEPAHGSPSANADETDGASTGKSEWLLIKRRDSHAVSLAPPSDPSGGARQEDNSIVHQLPYSVLTGRSMDEILRDNAHLLYRHSGGVKPQGSLRRRRTRRQGPQVKPETLKAETDAVKAELDGDMEKNKSGGELV